MHQLPQPPFISLKEASESILTCSIERIRFFVNEGYLTAYALTPTSLPIPTKATCFQEENIFMVPPPTAMFWQDGLAEHCGLKTPITWRSGFIECNSISIINLQGEPATPSSIPISDRIGRIGECGELFWKKGFIFKEDEILFKIDELYEFAAKNTNKQPSYFNKKIPPHPAKTRTDALGKILLNIVSDFWQQNNRSPQYSEVFHAIKALAKPRNHRVIQEVEDNKIFWKDNRGKDKSTSVKQLQNRLTKINKVQNILRSNE